MKIDLHYYVDFQADFCRPDSIDEPTGSELATILDEGLRERGYKVVKTEASDLAHYIECEVGLSSIELMVGAELLDDAKNTWYVLPCPKQTIWGRQKVSEEDCRQLFLGVNDILQECERISRICWYPFFDTPEFLALMPLADSPIPAPDYVSQIHPLIKMVWRVNQFTAIVWSPPMLIGLFVLVCVFAKVAPKSVAPIGSILFCTIMVLPLIVPFFLSALVYREANRLDASNDDSSK